MVRDNPAAARYELPTEAGLAFIDYAVRSGGPHTVRVLLHAEVPAALRGRGVGAQLTGETLELIRAAGERVIPRCSYVVQYIARHPQYQDLVERA